MAKGYIYDNQTSLWGNPEIIGFGKDDFYIKEIDRSKANKIIVENHYSEKYYNASYIHLGMFNNNDEIVGVLQYGYAMNPASCSSVVEGTEMDEYLELNRMWLHDSLPRNTASQVISYSIKYIKRKYPKIKWIQSFADERCNRFGVVYQAANFDYYGEHTSKFYRLEGEVYHKSLMGRDPDLTPKAKYLQENKEKAESFDARQFRYIYWINQGWKNKCNLEEKEYPKHYKEKEEKQLA